MVKIYSLISINIECQIIKVKVKSPQANKKGKLIKASGPKTPSSTRKNQRRERSTLKTSDM